MQPRPIAGPATRPCRLAIFHRSAPSTMEKICSCSASTSPPFAALPDCGRVPGQRVIAMMGHLPPPQLAVCRRSAASFIFFLNAFGAFFISSSSPSTSPYPPQSASLAVAGCACSRSTSSALQHALGVSCDQLPTASLGEEHAVDHSGGPCRRRRGQDPILVVRSLGTDHRSDQPIHRRSHVPTSSDLCPDLSGPAIGYRPLPHTGVNVEGVHAR